MFLATEITAATEPKPTEFRPQRASQGNGAPVAAAAGGVAAVTVIQQQHQQHNQHDLSYRCTHRN